MDLFFFLSTYKKILSPPQTELTSCTKQRRSDREVSTSVMTKTLLFLPSLQAIILLLISTIFQCDAQRLLNTVAVLELHPLMCQFCPLIGRHFLLLHSKPLTWIVRQDLKRQVCTRELSQEPFTKSFPKCHSCPLYVRQNEHMALTFIPPSPLPNCDIT